ncbi:hypothetical protein [Sphingobacterium sp.]|uniref:hypothetical protein n=1 Tax=Sphingobacterium sp. TaxID=341027 RepID=UPI0031D3A3B7
MAPHLFLLDVARQIGSGLLTRNNDGQQQYNGKTYQDIVQFLGGYNAFNISNEKLVDVNGKLNPNAQFKYKKFHFLGRRGGKEWQT